MKFAIALNSKSGLIAQLNAVGHIALGLPSLTDGNLVQLRQFADTDGLAVATLTDHPLILFEARRAEHLRDAHRKAIEAGVVCNAFFECMRSGDPESQMASVQALPVAYQDYVAVGFFGTHEQIKPITRQFSLYRGARLMTEASVEAGGGG